MAYQDHHSTQKPTGLQHELVSIFLPVPERQLYIYIIYRYSKHFYFHFLQFWVIKYADECMNLSGSRNKHKTFVVSVLCSYTYQPWTNFFKYWKFCSFIIIILFTFHRLCCVKMVHLNWSVKWNKNCLWQVWMDEISLQWFNSYQHPLSLVADCHHVRYNWLIKRAHTHTHTCMHAHMHTHMASILFVFRGRHC